MNKLGKAVMYGATYRCAAGSRGGASKLDFAAQLIGSSWLASLSQLVLSRINVGISSESAFAFAAHSP